MGLSPLAISWLNLRVERDERETGFDFNASRPNERWKRYDVTPPNLREEYKLRCPLRDIRISDVIKYGWLLS